jgi:hypothetical protein
MQDLKKALVTLKELAVRRVQLVGDHRACTLVMRSADAFEKAAAVDGLDKIARQIPMWLERVESILGGAYTFLPEVVRKADGTVEGTVYNAYRFMIEHVIASASTELSRGLLDLGIASPLLDRLQSQLDVQHLLQLNDEVQAAAAAVAPPPVPPGFSTPAASTFALRPDGEFDQCALSLAVGVAAAHAAVGAGAGGGGGGGSPPDDSPGAGGFGAGGHGARGFGGGAAGPAGGAHGGGGFGDWRRRWWRRRRRRRRRLRPLRRRLRLRPPPPGPQQRRSCVVSVRVRAASNPARHASNGCHF